MKQIVLGVTGSIAAYKAAEIANLLTKDGCAVHVIMTAAAQKFIAPLTFRTLTKQNVYTDMFENFGEVDVRHISLADRADLLIVAPATANILGKLASGIADDMLSATLMAAFGKGKPVLLCPAMNTGMYENPVTKANVARLSGYGFKFVEPKESRLACGDLGKGALADVETIMADARKILFPQ